MSTARWSSCSWKSLAFAREYNALSLAAQDSLLGYVLIVDCTETESHESERFSSQEYDVAFQSGSASKAQPKIEKNSMFIKSITIFKIVKCTFGVISN